MGRMDGVVGRGKLGVADGRVAMLLGRMARQWSVSEAPAGGGGPVMFQRFCIRKDVRSTSGKEVIR
jgi:hypothetical protein